MGACRWVELKPAHRLISNLVYSRKREKKFLPRPAGLSESSDAGATSLLASVLEASPEAASDGGPVFSPEPLSDFFLRGARRRVFGFGAALASTLSSPAVASVFSSALILSAAGLSVAREEYQVVRKYGGPDGRCEVLPTFGEAAEKTEHALKE